MSRLGLLADSMLSFPAQSALPGAQLAPWLVL
jgi:hypothetical protein